MKQELVQRAEGHITQLRRRANDFYDQENWEDGDFLVVTAEIMEDLILPAHLARKQDG